MGGETEKETERKQNEQKYKKVQKKPLNGTVIYITQTMNNI